MENVMEFLTNQTMIVPEDIDEATVEDTKAREYARVTELARQGHLLRLWRPPAKPGEWRTFGLYRADDEQHLNEILDTLPLRTWMTLKITPLSPHPYDPAAKKA